MGRKSLTESDRLHQIQAAVPLSMKNYLESLAADERRTISQIVRGLLEDSPRIKAWLRQTNQNGRKLKKG